MEIGQLRVRLTIQTFTETQDDTHRTRKVWADYKIVWAKIEPVKGLVMLDTKQVGVGVTHKVWIRYLPHITTEKWILFDSRRFRIRAVRNLDERNRFLELLCEEEMIALDNFEASVDAVENPLRELLE